MLVGGEHSMVKIIGRTFAEISGSNWTIFSSFLGAIGSFSRVQIPYQPNIW